MAKGYRQRPDGSWEQPKDALKRVELRSLFNKIAVAGVVSVAFGLGFVGCTTMPDSPEPRQNDQIYQSAPQDDSLKTLLASLALLAAGGVAAVGGSITSAVAHRNSRSLAAIRQDVADGMIVDKDGHLVAPGHHKPENDVAPVRDVAPR